MNKDSFFNYTSLLDREVYDFYRENRYRAANGINDYNLYKKAVGGLFELLRKMVMESEGGVYIENLGYFCYIISNKKSRKRITEIKNIPLREKYKKKYTYFPYFFPDENLEDFTASKTLKLLNTTKKRKLHFDICESKKQGYLEARRIERGDS